MKFVEILGFIALTPAIAFVSLCLLVDEAVERHTGLDLDDETFKQEFDAGMLTMLYACMALLILLVSIVVYVLITALGTI